MAIDRGVANFTLDRGQCPPWLFKRMVKLAEPMVETIVREEGADVFVERIGDPVWFQSLGTALAFDWNASGLTTVLTAALKEAIKNKEKDLGIFICGGKGKTSKEAPSEIKRWGTYALEKNETRNLVYNSKMSAKVDSSLIQDGFQIYHHSFFFSKDGSWTVVQQGMNKDSQSARRYHWHSNEVEDLISEPHSGIATQLGTQSALNLTSEDSEENRGISNRLVSDGNYKSLMKDLSVISKHASELNQSIKLEAENKAQLTFLNLEDREFSSHPLQTENFHKSTYLKKILWKLCESNPTSYEDMISTQGVGPKTVRALALVSEIIYGADTSYEDPARFSFAHGGKDSTPYDVDRDTYDETINKMKEYVRKSEIEGKTKDKMMSQLI